MARPRHDIPFATDAEIETFVVRFEACEWPYERWTHRAHLALAVVYLRRYPPGEALAQVRAAIQRYNKACGDPNGYHETITVLFMRRVNWALHYELTGTLVQLVDGLYKRCTLDWLLRYYSRECLWSAAARAGWIEPDLCPLDF